MCTSVAACSTHLLPSRLSLGLVDLPLFLWSGRSQDCDRHRMALAQRFLRPHFNFTHTRSLSDVPSPVSASERPTSPTRLTQNSATTGVPSSLPPLLSPTIDSYCRPLSLPDCAVVLEVVVTPS
ncbi:hypothetical protein BJ165DRAFT_766986 [Panaeolus papilionaceus]|nr:hypothetical protein BJ165DRAFT_766986 [Panaeolus papilionaceus]